MLRMTRRFLLAASAACILAPLTSFAEQPLNVSVDGNVYTADLSVAGGFSAELTVTFENVVGLTPASLNVSASAVNPLDPALLGRIGSAVSGIPAGFPLKLTIEPDPARGLSFSGVVTVELYTHDLEFVPGSPLRFYSAPLGGAFRDITVDHSAGSYRTAGTKGNFSEFLVVVETRTALQAAADKFGYLRNLLDGHSASLDPAIYADLSGALAAAEGEFAANSLIAAVTYIEDFADSVEAYGGDIPNVWSASHSLENVAGQLRAAAGTLRFSLTLAINGS